MPHLLAHGIDIVEVPRIARMLEEHGERFLDRCFTGAEREYCLAGKRRDEHLAARFAAKEAVLKALGTGWKSGIAWTDVEVVRDPSGAPLVRLHGAAAAVAAERGIGSWSLSLSHTEGYAVASAIGTAG
jgi:holo-[acyl-carrier protein] synthase